MGVNAWEARLGTSGRWPAVPYSRSMRWERLFADLEARLAHEEARELELDVAERVRAERARTRLADRVAAVLERPRRLVLRLEGAGVLEGEVSDLGADWLLLRESPRAAGPASGRESLVPLDAVLDVRGLPWSVDPRPGVAMRRYGIGTALRALSRDRALVRVVDRTGATFVGTIDRVGADHLDLAEHAVEAARREVEVYGVRTLRAGALACVSATGAR